MKNFLHFRFQDLGLKWKLILPFLFLVAMGAITMFVVSYRFGTSLIHVNEAERLRNQYQIFLNDIEMKRDMAMSLAFLVAKNPAVAEAFARRDRDRLIELLLPAYQTLSTEFGVKQFHFHVPPATSFLRLHALQQYGEEMESYRHTINKARETGTGVGGIERGVFGLGIRSVVPVFYQGAQIGTVEIGLSLEKPLLEEFKRNYGADLLLYVEKEPGKKSPKVFASTLDGDFLSPDLFRRCFVSGEVIFHADKLGDRNMAVIVGPVRDFSSQIIGVIEIGIDREPTLALLKQYGSIATVIGLICLALSVSFVLFVSMLFTRRIREVVEAAEEIAAGRRDTGIAVVGNDELGVMAQALNEMMTSLAASRRQLQEYAQNLEEMVAARTRSLVESEQTYRTLVENVPLVVYMVMADGTTMFLNRSIEQMIGMSPQQLNGHHKIWAEHLHPEDRDRVIALRDACLQEGRDLHVEYRMLHQDGHLVYGFDHAVAVFDDNRALMRMDGIVFDVTAQKELHKKTLQAEELETLAQISGRLAHEVRNPLTVIGGLTRRLLKSFELSDPRTKKGEFIVEQVEKLEKILKMMLAYIEPQSVRLQFCDLNGVVSEAVEDIRARLYQSDFSVTSSLSENPHIVKIDPELFKKVLIKLMENGFSRMGEKGEIAVSIRQNGEYVSVILAYRVSFLSDDDVEHFFYPFAVPYPFAAGGPDVDIIDAPICKVIVNKLGGIITVSKEEDNLVKITIALSLEEQSGVGG